MSEAISRHQRELASSCYRGYVTDFILNGRRNNRLAVRAERHLVRSIVLATAGDPTKQQLLDAFRELIEQIESEWDQKTLMPPRPHGL